METPADCSSLQDPLSREPQTPGNNSSWLDMDQDPPTRRRAAAHPSRTRPPIRLPRDRPRRRQDGAQEDPRSSQTSKVIVDRAWQAGTADKARSAELPSTTNYFTVANVGAGGTLYLKPCRMPLPVGRAPATPPPTSEGRRLRNKTRERENAVSDQYSALRPPARPSAKPDTPLPPISLQNTHRRRQHSRSRSFSGLSDHTRSRITSFNGLPPLMDGYDANRRPSSFLEPAQERKDARFALADKTQQDHSYIPYTPTMQNGHKSQEEPKLFTTHPSQARIGSQMAHPYTHPAMAFTSVAPPALMSYVSTSSRAVDPAIFDQIEKTPDDPALVQYDSKSGKIMAATVGRLVFQITSPKFLDYELLSDFFLAYRCFMSCAELLSYLFARMKWALGQSTDTGRIVRVRAFVAIRHWVLNYFADDFLPELSLRQQFCDVVNDLARDLCGRKDQGGADLGIIGELKKCWRRICAMFWPDSNALESASNVDILPGGDPAIRASATSLIRQASVNGSRQRLTHIVSTPPLRPDTASTDATGVIPASPTSDHSLQVLSCSVPFLRKNATHVPSKQHSSSTNRTPPLDSFSTFTAESHAKGENSLDSQLFPSEPATNATAEMRSFSLTGGLIRGLLLQPAPPYLDMLIPLTPGLEPRDKQLGHDEGMTYRESNPHTSMSKIVGGVKRALSARRGPNDAPSRGHRANLSTDSRMSIATPKNSPGRPIGAHMPTGTKVDMLGMSIESAYEDAVDDDAAADMMLEQNPYAERDFLAADHHDLAPPAFQWERMNSHVTTGSRSIVIVDATGESRLPGAYDDQLYDPLRLDSRDSALDSDFSEPLQSMPISSQPQHASAPAVLDRQEKSLKRYDNADPGLGGIESESGAFMDDHPLILDNGEVSPELLEPPHARQLRRIPGGDLKMVENIQELGSLKADEVDSPVLYTPTDGVPGSQPLSELSGTHFSGQEMSSWRIPLGVVPGSQDRSSWSLLETHSSQPNLRASLQSCASRLRKVPDGEGDGGIENTLLRLEGRSPVDDTFEPLQIQGLSDLQETSSTSAARSAKSSPGPIDSANVLSLPPQEVSPGEHEPSISPKSKGQPVRGLGLSFRDSWSSSRTSDALMTPKVSRAKTSRRCKESFLLSETESLSDISTALGDLAEEDAPAMRSFFFDDSAEARQKFQDKLGQRVEAPPTPATTITSFPAETFLRSKPFKDESRLKGAASAPKLLPSALEGKPLPRLPFKARPRAYYAHLPFVMAFDAEVIAEQMTIIEKDALDEVDWKDLVGLIWHQTPPPVHNWVDYLKNEDSNGIDVVVARFNLVVKWIVSECVLTELMSERARCISKYIHIASHCLRFRNYASMYQITLALLSSDLSRLTRTWALVPLAERQMLSKLEKLCQPVRNFHNLRVEMESSGSVNGCIPFIGLYTHDLMFNAQKRARYEPSPPATEALVNFERFQTAATIVKSLLRLIDASTSYTFRPHPEVLSRCLWLAALDDHEIHARSLALEDGMA